MLLIFFKLNRSEITCLNSFYSAKPSNLQLRLTLLPNHNPYSTINTLIASAALP